MFCKECGEKLTLRFCEDEGLVPYCNRCEAFKFPQFNLAVSLVVTNREQNKVLLAKHTNQEDYILFAGYVKRGETAEKTVVRELKEETKLTVLKYKYMLSRYHEARDVLMLNYIAVIDENEKPTLKEDELQEVSWFSLEEAEEKIKKNSTAEYFLLNAIKALKHKI